MSAEDYKFTRYYRKRQDTRWADMNEVMAVTERVPLHAAWYPAAGLPVLNNGSEAYVDASDTHSLIFGSTGSKKTRLFCMPMLNIMIGAGESFIATDPKGELYERTSGLAGERGYRVVVLNYRDLSAGDTWNPLILPHKLYHSGDQEGAVARLGDFVNAISEKHMENTKDVFWVHAARSVALSILILMMDTCTRDECNLRTFTRFCVEFAKGTTDKLMMKAAGMDEDDMEKNYLEELMKLVPPDHIARLNYDGIANSSDRARGDVQSTLFTMINVFMTQEQLVRNMSRGSFDIRDFGREKTAVYLIVPDERTTFHFIASIFIKQCYETLIIEAQNSPQRQLPLRVNFVLDEFANIPAIPDMPSMITAARSRNMRFYLVVQSMHQLLQKYKEEAQTIKGNCDNWVFLTSKEIDLLDEISKLCGNVRPAEDSLREWPLISVSQLQRLSKQRGEALIFCGRQYPFITEMTDIDVCAFETPSPYVPKPIRLEETKSIGPEELYTVIRRKKRPHPFAKGEEE